VRRRSRQTSYAGHFKDCQFKQENRLSYQEDLKEHLADFKRVHLAINEPGLFRYRGRDVECHHILPLVHGAANLFEEARSEADARFTDRHMYFHHLNSSQAFAFNLFIPYFTGGLDAASSLLRALGSEGVLDKWDMESVPALAEGSNIDVLWSTSNGVQTFCEVKLSEAHFGKAADDERHYAKLTDMYSPILAGHLAPERLERASFFDAYQFNRNVWHMVRTEHSRLCFLLPRANTGLWNLLQEFLSGALPQTRSRISAVAIEDVITYLCADDLCPAHFRDYAHKLRKKYVLPDV
jgi:hypothetical protein